MLQHAGQVDGAVAALHVGGVEAVAAVAELHHLAGRVAHRHVVVQHQVLQRLTKEYILLLRILEDVVALRLSI